MSNIIIPSTRERILAVYKLLLECDEDSPMTRNDIVAALDLEYDFNAALGTITGDTNALEMAELIKINDQRGTPMKRRGSYGRFDNNYLKDWELKILLDSLGKCIFLSFNDIENIKKKLWSMTSKNVRKSLEKNQTVLPKEYYTSPNGDGSYTFKNIYIDVLKAINLGLKISFNYGKLNCQKQFNLNVDNRNDEPQKRLYTVNPYKIYYMEKFFYLLATFDNSEKIYQYRIDRIRGLKILDEKRVPIRNIKELLESFISNNTDNFVGEERTFLQVKWHGASNNVSVLYDVFGLSNVYLISDQDLSFNVNVANNQGLYNTLLRLGPDLEIISPINVRSKLIEKLNKYKSLYNL